MDRLSEDHAVVPALRWFEVRNILIDNERRGHIESADSDMFGSQRAGSGGPGKGPRQIFLWAGKESGIGRLVFRAYSLHSRI